MSPSKIFALAKQAMNAWLDDFAPSMGAAIAYYTVFSIAPLLVIVIALAGFFFGEEAVRGSLETQISGLVGSDGGKAIQGLVADAGKPAEGALASGIGLAVLLFGATTVFGEIQGALDRIWHVPERARPSGIWGLLRARFLSFGLILGLAFLLMTSLVVSAVLAAFGTWIGGLLPAWELLLQAVNLAISLGAGTVLFAMIYKLMPSVRIAWRDVWVGAGVTAFLFEVGKLLIALYVGKAGISSSYAAAGSIAVVLIWVYYAAQVFLLGAEFTKVYAADRLGLPAGAAPTEVAGDGAAVDAAHGPAKGGRPGNLTVQGHPASVRGARPTRAAEDGATRVAMAVPPLVTKVAVSAVLFVARFALRRWLGRRRRAPRIR